MECHCSWRRSDETPRRNLEPSGASKPRKKKKIETQPPHLNTSPQSPHAMHVMYRTYAPWYYYRWCVQEERGWMNFWSEVRFWFSQRRVCENVFVAVVGCFVCSSSACQPSPLSSLSAINQPPSQTPNNQPAPAPNQPAPNKYR